MWFWVRARSKNLNRLVSFTPNTPELPILTISLYFGWGKKSISIFSTLPSIFLYQSFGKRKRMFHISWWNWRLYKKKVWKQSCCSFNLLPVHFFLNTIAFETWCGLVLVCLKEVDEFTDHYGILLVNFFWDVLFSWFSHWWTPCEVFLHSGDPKNMF